MTLLGNVYSGLRRVNIDDDDDDGYVVDDEDDDGKKE